MNRATRLNMVIYMVDKSLSLYVTGFAKTIPNHIRNTKLKYLNHCGTLMLDCDHARFTAKVEYIVGLIRS